MTTVNMTLYQEKRLHIMYSLFSRIVHDIINPPIIRTWFMSLGATVLVLIVLWSTLLSSLSNFLSSDIAWIQWIFDAINSLWFLSPAVLIASFFLFPPLMIAILMLFADRIISCVEQKNYPHSTPQPISWGKAMQQSLLYTAKIIGYNIACLPIYLLLLFIPPLSLLFYYAFNGWLLGQEYFYSVGSRQQGYNGVRNQWQTFRLRGTFYGAVCIFGLNIPFVNLIVPIVGLIGMVHLWHDRQNKTKLREQERA